MKVVQICVGTPCEVEFDGKRIRTSIFKSPVEGCVAARVQNIDGDGQADLSVHGGRDKAIYIYSRNYYDDWSRDLGMRSLQESQFGENLTITNGTDEQVLIGARYQLGEVIVRVTQPRIPCFKLGIRLNDKNFPRKFWSTGRLGFYVRVEREGLIERGQSINLLEKPDHDITIRKLYDIVNGGTDQEAEAAMSMLPQLDDGWIRRLRQIASGSNESRRQ